MLLVVTSPDEPGITQLNFMWLPTWLGMNGPFQADLKAKLGEKFVGMPVNDETLAIMSAAVLDAIVDKYPGVTGLRQYLEALEHVGYEQEQK